MDITAAWLDSAKTRIGITFDDAWTWGDLPRLKATVTAMLHTVDHRVCFIADLRALRMMPRRISVYNARELLSFDHPNSELAVIVGANPYIRTLLDSLLKRVVHNDAIRFVETMAEAEALLDAIQGAADAQAGAAC